VAISKNSPRKAFLPIFLVEVKQTNSFPQKSNPTSKNIKKLSAK